jgi:5,10-methylene-tetrahydrofolate dehydrogenase/methenyl tetrahydrofolate cyclohydrolase
MALRPDRVEHLTDLSFFMNETAERGVIVAHSTAGSGAAMDDSNAVVAGVGATSDLPAGMLLNDVVNIDLTRQHLNFHQDEVQIGSKVLLLRRGTVVTDQVAAGLTISPGGAAHFTSAGLLTTGTSSAQVGRFLSDYDADGYVKVEINIV